MRFLLLPEIIILQQRLAPGLEDDVFPLGVDEQVPEFRADGTVAFVDLARARGGECLGQGDGVADCVAVAVCGVGCALVGGHFVDGVRFGEAGRGVKGAFGENELKR